MLVEESRMLEVSIFYTLRSNAHRIDFNVLSPDVMVIVDEVGLSTCTGGGKLYRCIKRLTHETTGIRYAGSGHKRQGREHEE